MLLNRSPKADVAALSIKEEQLVGITELHYTSLPLFRVKEKSLEDIRSYSIKSSYNSHLR